ncbi:DNA repair protein RecN [Eubacteriales bacterium OttesenSCG-928-N13]|nr:DNA repair protein RecN [Eubacteriales bacterium OttesenSCG-928-N13]
MLLELSIKNIALIEQLRVQFKSGLNVLTGETGAGKSIVVDSVNMALGARVNRDLIRTGADSASVQALFDVRNHKEILALLGALGIEIEDGQLVAGREMSVGGRSICRLQGEVVPLGKYRQITKLLVDVHGQHEHQSLLDSVSHMLYLDASGDEHHHRLMDDVSQLYEEYSESRRELDRLSTDLSQRERKLDMLNFQISEIEAVKPKAGEDAELEQKANLMRNAEKISGSIEKAYNMVYQGEGKSIAAQDALKRAAEAMRSIGSIDERFAALGERLDELFYQAQDLGYELGDLKDGIEYDPALGERIEDRLSDLKRLKRKYGPELSDVLDFLKQSKKEQSDLDMGDERVQELKRDLKKRQDALHAACERLTQSRKALAKTFSEELIAQLQDLGMARTRFDVRFDLVEPTREGADKLEFLISPNPGEPLKPLSQIASGGELARIMLAMKAISADSAGVDTMIFDEIDTGVSGRMAQVVGEKMAMIARTRQVICVTHLPQIAALGQAHYLVEKSVVNDRTGSAVYALDQDGRVKELARLLGGAGSEQSGLIYAKEMLEAAQKLLKQ